MGLWWKVVIGYRNESVSSLDAFLVHKIIALSWLVQSIAEVVDCSSGYASRPQWCTTCSKRTHAQFPSFSDFLTFTYLVSIFLQCQSDLVIWPCIFNINMYQKNVIGC